MGRGRKRIIVIGNTETGKSTLIKEIIEPRLDVDSLIVYDPNDQAAWYHLPEITLEQFARMKKGKYRVTDQDYKRFWKTAFDNYKDGILIAEDATNYLKEKRDSDVMPNLIALRHPKHNVDIILTTHSIGETPPYLIRNCHEIILKKTNDSWDIAKNKFDTDKREKVESEFRKVNRAKSNFEWGRIVMLQTGTL